MFQFALALLTLAAQTSRGVSSDLRAQAAAKENASDWRGAAALWEQEAEANPSDPLLSLSAANDWYKAKDFQKAIPDFQKANALGVSYKWDMPYSIACCEALLGHKEAALKGLEKVVNDGFRDLKLMQTDTDLTSLHGDPRFTRLTASDDVTKMDRSEGYRYDLWLLNRELRRMHYDPYRRYSKAEFDHFVSNLRRDIPKLSDNEIAVRFKQLAAMCGDGHTHITTPTEGPKAKMGLPAGFMYFREGLFVIRADKAHQDLLGQEVLAIDGHSVKQLEAAVKPICSYDNSMWILAHEVDYFRSPALLNGLELIASPKEATLTVKDAAGKESSVKLHADGDAADMTWKLARELSANPAPLTFVHRDKNYWFEQVPDTKTIYVEYNAVADMPEEPIEKFAARLFEYVDSHDVDKLILDMRWNGGGNNFLNKPLLEGLIKSKLNVTGKLFVIVGRNTFSAAICGVTQIERYTNAIFAGEPTGSSPNFIGESIPISLPYSHMRGTVSDLYWQNSVAMDHRTWIAPKIYAPPSITDYLANRDPVIDLIRDYHE
jgi:hypothetical protein